MYEQQINAYFDAPARRAQLVESILDKLFVLPEDTMVYPGHGDPTTIGHEKQYNPVTFYRRHTL